MKEKFDIDMQWEAEQVLKKHLPSGSGIDCKWEFEWFPTRVVCRNSWHCMNEHGFYEGYADFSLILYYKKHVKDFRLEFNGYRAHQLNRKHMIREYLEDHFYYFLVNEEGNPIKHLNCFEGRMPVDIIN